MRSWIALAFVAVVALASCSQIPSPDPLPQGVTFAGVWDSNWGQIKLQQQGSHVHGTYKGFRNGSVSGDIDGNLFIFRWTQVESQQWGRGYLQLSPDGLRMEGRWGYRKNAINGGRWWASKAIYQQ